MAQWGSGEGVVVNIIDGLVAEDRTGWNLLLAV